MRRVMLSTIAAVLLTTVLPAPSYADGMLSEVTKFPMTMTSFVAGTVLGTPIAVGRKVMNNTKETCDNMAGDKGMAMKAACGVVALPVGLFTGSLEGMYLGPKNALYNSGESPFSKDCFSLGDLD